MTATSPLVHLAPDDLTIHPALENFPGLSNDQLAALTLSARQFGILSHLVADEQHQVYDGRALLLIAREIGVSTVPVIIRPEANVLVYAIERAVNRRQLTRSGIALLLFEQHPELAKAKHKGGRPKNCSLGEQLSANHDSYRNLGARYRVPHQYFSNLAEMYAGLDAEQWAELRRLVLFEEASVPRQYAGFCTGNPAGAQRSAVIYAALNAQGELDGILPRSFASLRNGFLSWRDVPTDAKAAVEKEWEKLLEDAPEELLRIAARKGARRG